MSLVTSEDIAYAAGLFDGEGCIHIARLSSPTRPNFTLHVKVSMTDPVSLNWLQSVFGGGLARFKDVRSIRRPCYSWQVYGPKAAAFLTLVLPSLKVKKAQALTALEFSKTTGQRKGPTPVFRRPDHVVEAQQGFYEEMKRLKTLVVEV